ncbi:MAG: M42 family metallopeptidase [Clostridiales bacterium]|jgi:endoglucanase|nr:M42 family metallopeptidase [Clostridiales bacterium]
MHTEDFLREITAIRGLSGDEGLVADFVKAQFEPLCDEVRVDSMFNVIARKKGPGPRVMFAAHMDEIGLMVVNIEEDGSLRMGQVGGVDPRILPGQRVTVFGKKKLMGVIGAKAPHLLSDEERKKNYLREDLYVDLGMDAEKVKSLVSIGDQIQLEHRYTALQNGRVSVKTADDRACVAILYDALKRLQHIHHEADLYFVATAQEEVGSRGALTSAYSVEPDYAVALDVCHADTPGAPSTRTHKQDSLVASMGPYIHPVLRQKLVDTAKDNNITLQTAVVPRYTSTDADDIGISRAGVPTALLELPLKYMHTTVEQLDLNTLKEGGRLLAQFAAAVSSSWEDELWT